MGTSNAVHGFSPSRQGLHFANRWAPGPTLRLGRFDPRVIGIGDAKDGLCGGMVWYVRECFDTGTAVPPDTSAPANGSQLFQTIVRRQVLSLAYLLVPLRFWRAARMPPDALRRRTIDPEWPRIRTTIDSGRLASVGLVRHHGINPLQLNRDHQALAYAYTHDGDSVTLRIYDPNHPDRDDVTLSLSPTWMAQSTGEALFGVIALS
jgi:hypothetical protein